MNWENSSAPSAALSSSRAAHRRLRQRAQKYIASRGYDHIHAMHWHRLDRQIADTMKLGKRITLDDPARIVRIRAALERIEHMMSDSMSGRGKTLLVLLPGSFEDAAAL